ncbi:MAG: hypothetical protein N4A63_13735 [Vallitalea sp.]|jgi:hypothetical protein|nr:hypothetical protein [Vallitalea sp.]
MTEAIRRTLLGTKIKDIEITEKPKSIAIYVENEHGACYVINIDGDFTMPVMLLED